MEKLSMSRRLITAVGGPIEAGENRKSWLARVASRAGLTIRTVKAAFYGEQLSRETERKLKLAAGRYEAEILAARFESLAQSLRVRDESFHRADIAALLGAARALRGLGRAGTDGG